MHADPLALPFTTVNQLSPEVERRRRLITRTLPLALVALVAFVVGAAAGAPGLAGEGRRQALHRGLGSAANSPPCTGS